MAPDERRDLDRPDASGASVAASPGATGPARPGLGSRVVGSAVGLVFLLVVSLPLLGLSGVFGYAAFHVWRGTVTAATDAGVQGTVGDITCAGPKSSCSGAFVSDDGRLRLERVTVPLGARTAAREGTTVRGTLVIAVRMPWVEGPNATDTDYPDGTRPVVVGYVLLALLLSVLCLGLAAPLLLGLRAAARNIRGVPVA